jgi:hypothetical protein
MLADHGPAALAQVLGVPPRDLFARTRPLPPAATAHDILELERCRCTARNERRFRLGPALLPVAMDCITAAEGVGTDPIDEGAANEDLVALVHRGSILADRPLDRL